MTSGMAHVSGAVMAAYVKIAPRGDPASPDGGHHDGAGHDPPREDPHSGDGKARRRRARVEIQDEKTGGNVIDAAAQGAGDGLQLALNIAGMLIGFLAMIAMVNGIFGWVHGVRGIRVVSPFHAGDLRRAVCAGRVGAGRAWKDARTIGNLLGTRLVLNEFVAFLELGPMKEQLDPRSFTIATYALCGFANFSSIAIQIGGIGAAPARKSDLARLGLRAVPPDRWPILCRRASPECSCSIAVRSAIMFAQIKQYLADGRLAALDGGGAGQRPRRLCRRVDRTAWNSRTRTFPAGPLSTAIGPRGQAGVRQSGGLAAGRDGGPRASCTKAIRRAQVTYGVRVLRLLGVRRWCSRMRPAASTWP